MQEEAKIRKFLPKFTENMQTCAKTSLFFAYKTLVILGGRKRSESTLQPKKKCAVSGCVWNDPGWILTVFIHFYEALPNFRVVVFLTFDLFGPFLSHFDTIWGHFWTKTGPSRVILGVILGHFWVEPRSFGGHFGSFGHRFGIILVSFWGRFDRILRPSWCLFGPFFLDHFWALLPILGWFYGHFVVFGWCLGRWLKN